MKREEERDRDRIVLEAPTIAFARVLVTVVSGDGRRLRGLSEGLWSVVVHGGRRRHLVLAKKKQKKKIGFCKWSEIIIYQKPFKAHMLAH